MEGDDIIVARVGSLFRIVIPKRILKKLQIKEGDYVVIKVLRKLTTEELEGGK